MKTPHLESVPERVISPPPVSPAPALSERGPQRSLRPVPPRKSPLSGLIGWTVTIALAVAGWYFSPYWLPWVQAQLHHTAEAPQKPAPRPTPVLTAPVAEESVNVYLDRLGTVTAYNTVTVRSRVDGELINVAFSEGQMVKQGDLLAEIDPRPYETQRDQAKGKMNQDEAALTLAIATLDRQKELMKSNATTALLIDQQVAAAEQARALLEIDKAVYENTLLQLEYCRITAPISGRIGLRLVDRGNIVRANDPNGLLIITQLEPISVVFTIPQDEIPRLQKRMAVNHELTVYAYDRDFKTQLAEGKLSAIDNQVDISTGTLRLKAMFENKDHSLFPNQFVNARLLLETLENSLVIPSVAIQRGPDNMFVYVVKGDTVELRVVTVGPVEGTRTCITSGLSKGEMVVTDGLDKLQDGGKVYLKEMGTPGKKKPEEANGPGSTQPSKQGAPADTPTEPSKKTA